jgi:hypothetical protein
MSPLGCAIDCARLTCEEADAGARKADAEMRGIHIIGVGVVGRRLSVGRQQFDSVTLVLSLLSFVQLTPQSSS